MGGVFGWRTVLHPGSEGDDGRHPKQGRCDRCPDPLCNLHTHRSEIERGGR